MELLISINMFVYGISKELIKISFQSKFNYHTFYYIWLLVCFFNWWFKEKDNCGRGSPSLVSSSYVDINKFSYTKSRIMVGLHAYLREKIQLKAWCSMFFACVKLIELFHLVIPKIVFKKQYKLLVLIFHLKLHVISCMFIFTSCKVHTILCWSLWNPYNSY